MTKSGFNRTNPPACSSLSSSSLCSCSSLPPRSRSSRIRCSTNLSSSAFWRFRSRAFQRLSQIFWRPPNEDKIKILLICFKGLFRQKKFPRGVDRKGNEKLFSKGRIIKKKKIIDWPIPLYCEYILIHIQICLFIVKFSTNFVPLTALLDFSQYNKNNRFFRS